MLETFLVSVLAMVVGASPEGYYAGERPRMGFGVQAPAVWRSSEGASPGTYMGDKKVMGLSVHFEVHVNNAETLVLFIRGPNIHVYCPDEPYQLQGSEVRVSDSEGDCIHDNMHKNHLQLKSVAYDAATQHIKVSLKAGFATFKVTLAKGVAAASLLSTSQPQELLFAQLDRDQSGTLSLQEFARLDTSMSTGAFGAAAPMLTGTFEGSKTALGLTLRATVVINDQKTLNLLIVGAKGSGVHVFCPAEPYQLQDRLIRVGGAQGDCVHDEMHKNHLELRSIAYKAADDSVHVTVKAGFATLKFALNKVAEEATSFKLGARVPASNILYSV